MMTWFSGQIYNRELCIPRRAIGCECEMSKKGNVVLYLDSELVKKSRELGFNLSRTFENHLKRLVSRVNVVCARALDHNINWVGFGE